MQNETLCCFAVGQKIGLVFANASRTNLCFCVQAVKSSLRKGTRHLNNVKDTGSPPDIDVKDPPAVLFARAHRRLS